MISRDVRLAARYIQEGRLVAFPTETVYGLGANVFEPKAVAKIFELKQRPFFDPLIVHVCALEIVRDLVAAWDERIELLAREFWPGPLTLVLPKSAKVPDIVCAGLDTVAIRMPDHALALELIRLSGCPLAAPSANKFGRLSPTTPEHVFKQLPDVDLILDGGRTKVGLESTIISLNQNGFTILRYGIITRKQIEKIIPYAPTAPCGALAPGHLKSHYSPSKPVYLLGQRSLTSLEKARAGLISFSGKDTEGYKYVEVLTKNQDLKEYAANLFAAMHKLEELDVDFIVAEPVPAQGIGLAIMDRLQKASYRYRR